MDICLLNPTNSLKGEAMNKDLAGGLGTLSDFGGSFTSKVLSFIKKKSVILPIISFAYIQAILKKKGHNVAYVEGDNITKKYDLILVYGSIVDFKNEVDICKKIKHNFPSTKIGFFGSFPSIRPDLFNEFDFVIIGEAESFFLYEFKSMNQIKKITNVKKILNLDDLPSPDFDNFPIDKYSYFPAIKEKPFLVLQMSKGCPYSCAYYCPYGSIQGKQYRKRSAENIFADILKLIKRYKAKGIQFRDPTFGIDKAEITKFCNLIIDNKIKIKFGIETRIDLLDKEIISLMFRAGLRNINVGVETINEGVAIINKRKLIEIKKQEEIIRYCDKIGVKISAFYIIGLFGDSIDSIKKTIDYAIKLNTNTAQFVISCPYPGTKYYDYLKSKDLIIEEEFEKFNSANLVFKHDKLIPKELLKLREYSFKRYYFRWGYILNFLKWRIREFWL